MKRILMTGCATGFGKTVKENLEAQGHAVWGIGKHGPHRDFNFATCLRLDDHIEELWDEAVRWLEGPVDVLLLNAGWTRVDMLEDHELSDFFEVMKVNLVAPFIFAREMARRVKADLKGSHLTWTLEDQRRIICTSSMGTQISLRGSSGYCASKAGLEALVRVWAKEFACKLPIISLGVAPGMVDDTAMGEYVVDMLVEKRGFTDRKKAEAYTRQSPLARNCTHDEVWKLYDFAVNSAPEQMSGAIIRMPGGMGI